MAKEHVFKGSTHHNGKHYGKGEACPEKLLPELKAKGLVEPLPEPVKPVQPKEDKDEK